MGCCCCNIGCCIVPCMDVCIIGCVSHDGDCIMACPIAGDCIIVFIGCCVCIDGILGFCIIGVWAIGCVIDCGCEGGAMDCACGWDTIPGWYPEAVAAPPVESMSSPLTSA